VNDDEDPVSADDRRRRDQLTTKPHKLTAIVCASTRRDIVEYNNTRESRRQAYAPINKLPKPEGRTG